MPESKMNRYLRRALLWGASNPVSAIGSVLAAGGLILLALFVMLFMVSGDVMNPYYGALGFLGLPMIVVIGGSLIAAGKLIFKGRPQSKPFWIQQLNIENEKKVLTVFGAAIGLFVLFMGLGGVESGKFMNSSKFCGQTCHSVMEPEAAAHANSAHANINCVSCHVGEGVKGLVVSKMRGSWQVIAVITGHFKRPIPAPVETLPSSEDTCQTCHNTEQAPPARIRVYETFKDDEKSGGIVSAIMMNVGSSKKEGAYGVHAHSSKSLRIRYYALDPKREKITWVEARTPAGTKSWSMEGEFPPAIEVVKKTSKGRPIYVVKGKGEMREMDCTDCHNRIGHRFKGAEEIADALIAAGTVDRSLPYAKRVLENALRKAAETPRNAMADMMYDEITAAWPLSPDAENIAGILADEARNYLYPGMNIKWGTYQNLNRHMRDQGCFRCHNQRMKDANGANLRQDCDYCHKTVADHIPREEFEKRLFPPGMRSY